ncbi:MAG: ATP-binding protein [Ginsengibacter sp.]
MIKPQVPENEPLRITELNKYNILDTLSEKDYDDITLVAATICKTPISLITFLDDERQWFKSHRGMDATETKKEYAFCAHALNEPQEVLIFPDSRKDKRFEEDQHRIFSLFTKLPSKKQDEKNSYGIGLATVKKIVEKNGGTIWLVSVVGKGTTFYFNIKKSLSEP